MGNVEIPVIWQCIDATTPAPGVGEGDSGNGSITTRGDSSYSGVFRPERDDPGRLLSELNYQSGTFGGTPLVASAFSTNPIPALGALVKGTLTVDDSFAEVSAQWTRRGPNGGTWNANSQAPFSRWKSVTRAGDTYTLTARGGIRTDYTAPLPDLKIVRFEFECGGQVLQAPPDSSADIPGTTGYTEYYGSVKYTVTSRDASGPVRVRSVATNGVHSAWCVVKLPPVADFTVTPLDDVFSIYQVEALRAFSPDSTVTSFNVFVNPDTDQILITDIENPNGLPKFKLDLTPYSLNQAASLNLGVGAQIEDAAGIYNGGNGFAGETRGVYVLPGHNAYLICETGLEIMARVTLKAGNRVADPPFPTPPGPVSPVTAGTRVEISRPQFPDAEPFIIDDIFAPALWQGKSGQLFLTARDYNSFGHIYFRLWRSTDAGRTWAQVQSTVTGQPISLWMVDQAYFVDVCPTPDGGAVSVSLGPFGLICKRSPDGITWPGNDSTDTRYVIDSTPSNFYPFRISYRLGELIVWNGRDKKYRSYNLGRNWEAITPDNGGTP